MSVFLSVVFRTVSGFLDEEPNVNKNLSDIHFSFSLKLQSFIYVFRKLETFHVHLEP